LAYNRLFCLRRDYVGVSINIEHHLKQAQAKNTNNMLVKSAAASSKQHRITPSANVPSSANHFSTSQNVQQRQGHPQQSAANS